MCKNDVLQFELEQAFQAVAQEQGETAVPAIRSIILTNLDQGRIETWLGTDARRTAPAYVRLVAQKYTQYKGYLYQIQVEKTLEVWEALYATLQKWAYNYLLRKSFYRNPATSQLATTYATEAAMVLLAARFPYDRNFEPWAHVLLINICRREMRRSNKASQIPDEKLVELNDELFRTSNPSAFRNQGSQELRYALVDAIESLSQETWQQVLLLRYFHNLSPADIAEMTGKTPSAIYNLHFKAMAALREVWHEKGYNYDRGSVQP
ncbi:MAG: sigma-70 family RNA polymerase sigma factor [Anaerolineales bacterium]|nr:sigma-70 family RNA polymerase sigma factor [Anaerolineales bacterium]